MDLLWLKSKGKPEYVPVYRRGIVYIATGEQGEWVRHSNLSDEEVTERITTMPHDETSIVSFAWPDKSYLSIRRQPNDVWQLMSRARIGWVEVLTEEHLSEAVVLQIALTFATHLRMPQVHPYDLQPIPESWTHDTIGQRAWFRRRIPPWKANHPWRAKQPQEQLWAVPFRPRFSPKFWLIYVSVMAILVAATWLPLHETKHEILALLTGFASAFGVAALSVSISKQVWVAGLHGIGKLLGEMPSITPVPVWEETLLPTQTNAYAYRFFEPKPPKKVLAIPLLLVANMVLCTISGCAVFLTMMGAILTYGSNLVG